MKIASFAFRSYPAKGGIEYHQKLISDYFTKKGDTVTVYTSRINSNNEFLTIDFKFPFVHLPKNKSGLKYAETLAGVTYKRFDIRCRVYSYNNMKNLYRTFADDIQNYNIVHLHGLNLYNNYRLARIAYDSKIPVILSCYDISIPDNLPFLTKVLKRIYDKLFIKKLDRYVTKFLLLTKDQITELKDLGINAKKICVWSAGYDVTRYRHKIVPTNVLKKYGLVGRKYVFNMGRIEEYKGIQDIVAIAKDFPKLQFVVAGRDQGYLETLRKLVLETHTENVQFIGEIDEKEATVLLQHAFVFVFPSKKEGWGIVLAEAMSVGVPCIAYNIPNVRTVFTNGKSGFYVNTFVEMKLALKKIIDNRGLRARMSKYSFKDAERYDYHNTLPVLETIYKENLQ